jgi:uncharacterized protein YuzE
MAVIDVEQYLRLVPALRQSPGGQFWSSYDSEADTLSISFKKATRATDAEITDDDVIIRYDGEEVIGLTILHASRRDR